MDEKQISELLECSVCFDRLDQTCKVLPCQHTFCRRCLDEILVTKNELRCPECRALVTVRVADLPTNILVVRILEGLKTKIQHSGGSRHAGHHGSLTSSPSKSSGSSPLHRHDAQSFPLGRQGTQPCAKALYNYDSPEKDDLSFRKDDVIILKKQVDENWYQGELSNRIGFLPANFVQVLVALPQVPQCKALYDFDLKDENEKDCLSFKKDEVLTVIRKVDENWLEGRKGEKIGIFPLTFVELNDSARSHINMKSNQTILPSLSSSPPSATVAMTSIATTSHVTDAVVTSSSSSCVVDTGLTIQPSLSSLGPSLPALSPPLSSQGSVVSAGVTQSGVQPTTASSHQSSLSSLSSTSSPTAAAAASVMSGTVQASSELVDNKRHSYTSSSLSFPSPSASVSPTRQPQRHSAEVTVGNTGSLTIASLPASTAVPDTQLTASGSAGGSKPSSPVLASELTSDTAVSSSSGSNGGLQSGLLTTPLYIALYNYKPQKEDELELVHGDHYSVGEKCQDGWFKGMCLRTGQAGVFPGNYVRMIRHSSAFKPVNPNVLNIRAKAPHPAPPHVSAVLDTRPSAGAVDTMPIQTPAPPLMPRVAKMNSAGQKSRSPSLQPGGSPMRSLSGTASISSSCSPSSSPKHNFSSLSSVTSSSTSSTSLPTTAFSSLSRGLHSSSIPASPLPAGTSSPPHRSLWIPTSMGAMSASNITPPNVVMSHNLDSPRPTLLANSKEKKEKKEKEKKGLVKLLVGMGKKSKPVVPLEPESAPPLPSSRFDNVAHVRSISYPAEGSEAGGDTSVVSAHRKAASFDSTPTPPVPAKPRPKLVLRERYCCIVPYPPQTEHELALEQGDIIHVHRKREDGWYKGTQERTGKTGMFPASFVDKCD